MTRYALNLPVDLKREAEEMAKKQGVSLNQFIMWSVAEKSSRCGMNWMTRNFRKSPIGGAVRESQDL